MTSSDEEGNNKTMKLGYFSVVVKLHIITDHMNTTIMMNFKILYKKKTNAAINPILKIQPLSWKLTVSNNHRYIRSMNLSLI